MKSKANVFIIKKKGITEVIFYSKAKSLGGSK